jgi:hypothetical protein
MASTDIRRFNFYTDYLWSPQDFEDFETWIDASIQGLMEGLAGAAVLQGLKATPGSGLTVDIAPGIASAGDGRIIVVGSTQQAILTAPSSDLKKVLVVLRPTLTAQTPIPEPTTFSGLVDLHEKFTFDVVVIDGAESTSPTYPSVQQGDVVVAGLTLSAGQSSLAASDFDLGAVDRPRKRKSRVRIVTGDYSMDGLEDIVEMDLASASGTVMLPAASGVEGQHYRIVRVDSSANEGLVSGSEPISGMTTVLLDTQWQTVELYSNGISWRMV